MTIKTEILAQLDKLLSDGKALIASYHIGEMASRYSDMPESDFRAFYTAGLAAIERVVGRESAYYRSLPSLNDDTNLSSPDYGPSPIEALFGALNALRSDVDAGLLQSLEARLRANVHDDILQQADDLLQAGYHVAAMVLVGAVFENHLQKMATTRNITWTGNGSISKYNDVLRNMAYSQPVWRRIQSIADLRNDAAHGNIININSANVTESLQYVKRFLADNPS
ncbi:MAG: hypothetical protein ACMUIU_13815 [bacterium]